MVGDESARLPPLAGESSIPGPGITCTWLSSLPLGFFFGGVFLRGFFSGFPGLILPLKATLRIPIRSRNNGQEELLTEYPLLNSHLFLYILKKPFAF